VGVSRKSLSFLLLAAALAAVVWVILRPDEANNPGKPSSRPAPTGVVKPFSESSAPEAVKLPTSPRPENATPLTPSPSLPENVKTGEEGALSPARTKVRLYGNARIKPLYNLRNNEIDGVQVSGVAPGSFWDELGIDDGDVILELNGELINTPAASVELMNQFSRGYVLNLRLRTAEGNERFIDYRTPSEP
jgi:type II secretory pathway component PulC